LVGDRLFQEQYFKSDLIEVVFDTPLLGPLSSAEGLSILTDYLLFTELVNYPLRHPL